MLLVRAAEALFRPASLQLSNDLSPWQRCDGSIVTCSWACCTQPGFLPGEPASLQAVQHCAACSCSDGDSGYTGDMCSLLAPSQSLQDFCTALRDANNTMRQCTQPIIAQVYSGAGCGGCFP